MQLELLNLAGAPVKMTGMWDGPPRLVQSHGRYADAVARGNCYTVSDTAGQLVPAGLSTAPATVTLYNPLGSGVFLSLIYAGLNLSVLWAVTAVAWVGVTPPSITSPLNTAAVMTTSNVNGKSAGGGSRVTALTPGSGAILLPSTPTIAGELGVVTHGAVTLMPLWTSLFKWFDGIIGVGPGGTLSFQASLVGPTAGAWGTWIWEEIPQSGSGPTLSA